MSKHPRFRKMILLSLGELISGVLSRASRYAIAEKILTTFNVDRNHHFKRNLRISLKHLVDDGVLLKVKQSFRIAPGNFDLIRKKKLIKKTRNIKRVVKKTIKKQNITKKNINNKQGTKKETKKKNKKQVKTKISKTATPKKKIIKKTKKITNTIKITNNNNNNNNIVSTKTTKSTKVQRALKHTVALNQPLTATLNALIANDDKNTNKEKKAVWQYYDNNNHNAIVKSPDGWYDYYPKASEIVEEEWQKYIKNRAMCDVRAVKSGQFNYQVDFISWTQQNLDHYAHTKRNIRRLDENGNITANPYQ